VVVADMFTCKLHPLEASQGISYAASSTPPTGTPHDRLHLEVTRQPSWQSSTED
jgi:hypothetical protein